MGEATGTFDVPESAKKTRGPLRRSVTTGLIAGGVLIYLAATGIVGAFEERSLLVGADGDGLLRLGYTMLLLVLIAAAYRGSSDKEQERPAAGATLSRGALTGLVAGAFLTLFALAIKWLLASGVDPNEIFPAIRAQLVDETLFLGLGQVAGVALLVLGGGALGAIAAGLHLMPVKGRRLLLLGLVTTLVLSMSEPLLRPIFKGTPIDLNILYERKALSIVGAIIIFSLSVIGSWAWRAVNPVARVAKHRGGSGTPARSTPPAAVSPPPARTAPIGDERDSMVKWAGLAVLAYALVIVYLFFSETIDPDARKVMAFVGVVLALVATAYAAVTSKALNRLGQRRSPVTTGLFASLAALALLVPPVGEDFVTSVLGNVGLYVLLGLGLNIVVGYAGLLDLGYVAFFAVGAYSMAILTARSSFLVAEQARSVADLQLAPHGLTNFWVALPITVVIAVVLGLLIGAPVLRLRGDYLAIVTLGFGEIIRTLVLSDWLDPWLGGAQGIIKVDPIPPPALQLDDNNHLYYLIIMFCFLAAFISYRLVSSRVGRAWAAMREDEPVAEAMGVSIIKYKLLAFAMGAGIGCLGGAFFAAKVTSVFPNSFTLLVSINVLAVIVLGGMGSIPGVVIGSLVLVGLPEVLREMAEYRLLFYGAILMAIMILRPEGLLPNVRRRRELHEDQPETETPPLVAGTEGGGP